MSEHEHDVERRLRAALEDEARGIAPARRLDEILDRAHAAAEAGPRIPRWVLPLTAAAFVALLVGVVWVTRAPGPTTAPAGTSTASVTSPPGTGPLQTGGTSTGSGDTSGSESPSTSPVAVALPVYFVGPVAGAEPARARLYREFFRLPVQDSTSEAAKALASLQRAMDPAELSDVAGYRDPWAGTLVARIDVAADLITITLSGPGKDGLDVEQARLAVQQLVWTAQAAVGRGNIPVTFEVRDGTAMLLGQYAASDRYQRPPKDQWSEDLAPIWVTSPSRDEAIGAGAAVTVSGQASVFEATVSWSLLRADREVDSGFATASEGAPGRGTYEIPLGVLPEGTYTVKVWEASTQDGHPIGTVRRTFSIG
jgi:hypothetical protein